MKRLFCFAFSAILLMSLFSGCQKKEEDVALDSTYVIVCAQEEGALNQAAKSLQMALIQKCGLELELVQEAPEGKKTVTVAVDASLAEGAYRTRIVDGNIAIEAQSEQVMIFAMRAIRWSWLGEGAEPKLTADQTADLSGTVDLANAPFYVLTQNIRYADDENGNKVSDRAPRYNKLVTEYIPDLIYMQEDNKLWSNISDIFFKDNYGVFGMFSSGPDAESIKGNRQAIFYRLDRYEALDSGFFWLSETPDEAYTKLEDSKSIRHCVWVLLKDKFTGKELLAVNTHMDNSTPEVRNFQLQVILDRLGDKMEQYPTVFCGDFNATPDEPVYATMTGRMSDPHVSATTKLSDLEITCDKYGTWETPKRIDYMFYNELLVANTYRIMTDRYPDKTGSYISDHFGVTTEYSFVN